MEDDKLISTKQASKVLGVSVSTVSRWYDQGVLTGEKNPLTSWRKISMKGVESLLKNFGLPLPALPEPKKEEPQIVEEVDKTQDTN